MPDVIVEEPYQFIPPVYSSFWPKAVALLVPGFIRKTYGVHSVETRDAFKMKASLDAGHGVLVAPNHSRLSDPLNFTGLVRETGRHMHAMASWHLFKKDWLSRFMLRRIGAFSLYREGADRQALETAIDILVRAQRPLVVFAEGAVSRHNDVLMPFMDGVSFIARTAAKRREKADHRGSVVIHPVAIRYFFRGDLEKSVTPVLEEIESHFAWHPQKDKTLIERIRQIAQALLSLKEIEYFGYARTGDFYERVDNLIEDVLANLEQKWGIRERESGVVARVKNLRTAILPGLINGNLTEAEKHERRKELAACFYVQQMSHYPRNYVRMSQKNVPEHILETVERFEEDFTSRLTVHGPLHAIVQAGDAIPVPAERAPKGEPDPIMEEVRTQLTAMLHKLAEESPRV
ncbi:MAG: 1-acyl-sn-glycerol-3-phosphate acyltransferase [Pirellulales bacterium]|nr:1-acyl-sn-glycerol-3-phosphate acyltransferase [Pirellulales bacterium]MBX3435385.1 1-acyl-sn-glycerol-3-phosphate acyltransferase [Pirellulales bacterium]